MDCDWTKVLGATRLFIKDLVPIVGLVIAGLGLQTWRRQLRGTTTHTAAFKTLRAAVEFRNALRDVRRARLFRIPVNQGRTSGELLQARYAQHRQRIGPLLEAADNLQA